MAPCRPKPFSKHSSCFCVQSILFLSEITSKKMMSSPGCRYGWIFCEAKKAQTSRPLVCVDPSQVPKVFLMLVAIN